VLELVQKHKSAEYTEQTECKLTDKEKGVKCPPKRNLCGVLCIFVAKKLLVARNRDCGSLMDPWELKVENAWR